MEEAYAQNYKGGKRDKRDKVEWKPNFIWNSVFQSNDPSDIEF